jgi:hypothetical protein
MPGVTKEDVVFEFRDIWRRETDADPSLKGNDYEKRFMWKEYLDQLYNAGIITNRQWRTWSYPF